MSSSLAPDKCPRCETPNSFVIYTDKMICRRCGYTIQHNEGVKQPKSSSDSPSLRSALASMFGDKVKDITPEIPPQNADTLPVREIRANYHIHYTGDLLPYARAAFNSGQAYIERKLYPEAKDAFLRALSIQPDFVECYYWLALLTTDPQEKREHLAKVVTGMPKHGEALRELMLLDGRITQAQAEAMKNPYLDAEKRRAGGVVSATSKRIQCPNCGSYRMTVDDVTGLPYCDSCGYIGEKSENTIQDESLFMALLKRRSQKVIWEISERLLLCNNCGADRTISGDKLGDSCPYCGSKQVVIHDALGSFSQPDSLIPFRITYQQAEERIKSQLNTTLARMRRLIDNTAVSRIALEGHFLPYWVFDATAEIRRSVIYNHTEDEEGRFQSYNQFYETQEFSDFVNDVLICAVKSPPKFLTDRLGAFDVRQAITYSPDLITKYSTQIYNIDFDRASLEARSKINHMMREKYGYLLTGDGKVQSVSAWATDMQFQLMLMPVWIATLYEKDGDIRTALVNGQTGTVVFGKWQKPAR